MALCPAHEDRNPSLHFTVRDNEERDFVFHCFAGCGYMEVLAAAAEMESHADRIHTQAVLERKLGLIEGDQALKDLSTAEWWFRYTQVPPDLWEQWGARFNLEAVEFRWDAFAAYKLRKKASKDFTWAGNKPSGTALWPDPLRIPLDGEEEGRKEIWLAEGESDCGILRFSGFPAYTFGGVKNFERETCSELLRAMGVGKVVLCLDADKSGREAARRVAADLLDEQFEVAILDLSPTLNRLKYETDIRDALFRHANSFEELRYMLLQMKEDAGRYVISLQAQEYLDKAPKELPYVCSPYLVKGSLTLLSGAAKGGKTTFTFALINELGRGGAFLGSPTLKCNVLYMTEDSPIAWRAKEQVHFRGDLDAGHNLRVFPKGAPELQKMSWLEKLQVLEREIGNAAVVVVDTVPVWAGIEDENDAVKVGQALEPLRRLAERKDVAVLAMHYHNKGEGARRGSTTFDAIPDILLDLDEGETDTIDDARRIAIKSKLSAAEESVVYKFDKETGSLHLITEKPESFRQRKNGERGRYARRGRTPTAKIEVSVQKKDKETIPVGESTPQGSSQAQQLKKAVLDMHIDEATTFAGLLARLELNDNPNVRAMLQKLVRDGLLDEDRSQGKPYKYVRKSAQGTGG